MIAADKLWPELETIGEDTVRKNLKQGSYGHDKVSLVEEWLLRKKEERELSASSKRDEREEQTLSIAKDANRIASDALAIARKHERWAMYAVIIAIVAAIIATMAYIKNS